MKSHFIPIHIFTLLITLSFTASCNGQIKTGLPEQGRQSKLIKTQDSDQYQSICCGLQDKNGNLWFGTSGEGIYRYDGQLFTRFTIKDGLSSNKIRSVLEDKNGNIWFGTTEGPCRYDGKRIVPVQFSGNFMPVIGSNTYYNDMSTKNTVWSLLQDKMGKIWMGTGDGVYCYDGKYFSRFLDNYKVINKDSLRLKMVSCILEDKKGNIWFASGMPPGMEGICYYDGTTLEHFKPQKETWVRKIIEEKNGNLLFATRHIGVLRYNLSAGKPNEQTFTNFSKPKEILNNSLTCTLADKKGNILFACDYGNTIGDSLGGVWRYSPSTDKTDEGTFTKLSSIEACFMLEDKAGNIWVGTRNNGLYRFDGKAFTCFSE